MNRRTQRATTYALPIAFAATIARGQCSGFVLEPGPGSFPNAPSGITVWDPDGSGPAQPTLVVSGGGGAARVVIWDGTQWQPLAPDVPGAGALISFNGDLIAATSIQTGGVVQVVSRWDGSAWVAFGDGQEGLFGGTPFSFAVHQGQLFAVWAAEFLRLNGTQWQRIGPFHGDGATALISYGGSLIGGGLVATSSLANYYDAVRWDGAPGVWSAVGDSMGSYTEQFAIHNGRLVAAGDYRVRQWDGATWETLGNLWACASAASYKGQLIVGGGFAGGVKRWDGATWITLGSGLAGGTGPNALRMVEWNGDLIITGRFTSANGLPAGNIARYRCIPCYANCDNSQASPLLSANDFQCFLNKYAAADSYANCDGSTSLPVLTANDFQCFLNTFAAGCT